MAKRQLRSGAPRLLGDHSGPRGYSYRRCWLALAREFPLDTPLLKLEAGRVAACWVNLEAASYALEEARVQRETGKGRRPSVHMIERLSRRQGLADQSYSQALAALRELVERHAQNGHGLAAALRDSR
jgi:hypothetical protein